MINFKPKREDNGIPKIDGLAKFNIRAWEQQTGLKYIPHFHESWPLPNKFSKYTVIGEVFQDGPFLFQLMIYQHDKRSNPDYSKQIAIVKMLNEGKFKSGQYEIQRAMTAKTNKLTWSNRYKPPLAAIKKHCINCMGGSRLTNVIAEAIEDCPSPDCHLYGFRGGKRIVKTSPLKAIRQFCLQCASGPLAVRECDGKMIYDSDCYLHPFKSGKNPKRAGVGDAQNVQKSPTQTPVAALRRHEIKN